MEDGIKDIAVQTGVSASQFAEGMYTRKRSRSAEQMDSKFSKWQPREPQTSRSTSGS